jgi:carbon storage regulator
MRSTTTSAAWFASAAPQAGRLDRLRKNYHCPVRRGFRRSPAGIDQIANQGGIPVLVLTRRLNETVVIEGDVRVTVVAIKGDKVRLGIEAPDSIRVDRAEVHARRAEFLDEPLVMEASGPTG